MTGEHMSNKWEFKAEDIFQDIDDDAENVSMTIPQEILDEKGKPATINILERLGMNNEEIAMEKILPNNTFRVLVQDKYEITCYTSGKMRQFKIKMIVGDKVRVEVSPYDLSKGRITFRL